MKLVLLGYMGCGKSTIGKQLASQLRLRFMDLDDYIEDKEQESIKNIFENKGEIYFRKIEASYLIDLLNDNLYDIISVGGGTPCFGENLEIININSTSVYLKASIPTLYERLKTEQNTRPLIKTIGLEKLEEFIGKHLFERGFFYNRAQKTMTVDNKSIEEIVTEIKIYLSLNTQWQHRF
ncbi:MAG: shikimate kinase [Flavobacteriaceae bacterium]|nr:MAG: shikimate kinase [Flavobacteriaceae bacterium]